MNAVISPFYRLGSRDRSKFSHVPRVTRLVNGEAGTQSHSADCLTIMQISQLKVKYISHGLRYFPSHPTPGKSNISQRNSKENALGSGIWQIWLSSNLGSAPHDLWPSTSHLNFLSITSLSLEWRCKYIIIPSSWERKQPRGSSGEVWHIQIMRYCSAIGRNELQIPDATFIQHGWSLTTWCSVEEALNEQAYCIWFHFLWSSRTGKTKLQWKNQSGGASVGWRQRLRKDTNFRGDGNVLYLVRHLDYTAVCFS